MMADADELVKRKQELRIEALAARRRQENKTELSREIGRRLLALPEYAAAATVMFYVHRPVEVHTQPLLISARQTGKRVVVPYCTGGRLALFLLESPDELAPGVLGILEPIAALRDRAGRSVAPSELDLVVTPGVAFDRRGGRLGHGKGYYDALLTHVRPEAPLVGLAFECQLLPEVPMLPHDVYMNQVITEKGIYAGKGRLPQKPE